MLSPYLFAVYLDSVIEKVKNSKRGCQINWSYVGILAYADDILLVAPTVMSLQTLVTICEKSYRNWICRLMQLNQPAYGLDRHGKLT